MKKFTIRIEQVLKIFLISKTKFKILRFPLKMMCAVWKLPFQGGYHIYSESWHSKLSENVW